MISRILAYMPWLMCAAVVVGLRAIAVPGWAVESEKQGLVESVAITAQPIASFDKTGTGSSSSQSGRLTFRGGLVLASPSSAFGGWSGLAISSDGGRLAAVSDEGNWLTADLDYDGTRPAAITNARIGPLQARDERTLKKKRDKDAEAISLASGDLRNGEIMIAFERNHRIGRFRIGDKGFSAPLGYITLPRAASRMERNKGFEAMAMPRSGPLRGQLIAFSESLLDDDGHHMGWIWIERKPKPISLQDIGGFDLTDLAVLPDGDLVLLERRFRWFEGVKMRLRLIKATELKSGGVISGEVLLEAGLGQEIDNMEGLAAFKDETGSVVLTLVSDDNFNTLLQRTILLQFAMPPAGIVGQQ